MKLASRSPFVPLLILVLSVAFVLTPLAFALGGNVCQEKLDRGLVALTTGGRNVYLSWRLLPDDPPSLGFHVYRRVEGGKWERVTDRPVTSTTDFSDAVPELNKTYQYCVVPADDTPRALEPMCSVTVDGKARSYISIKLGGNYTFQKVGIADLDGDGSYDFVIKQPDENIDPYERYWKPSPNTYKLEAYRSDGKFLWRYDLGWAIERGIWYSPYVVYDLDCDGRAEVATKTGEGDPRDPDGRVTSGPEYLTIFDGLSGRVITRVDWPSREGFGEGLRGYNYASRNQLCIAYLDGRRPALVVERGTYGLIKLVAYRLENGRLVEVWRWDNSQLPRTYWGQGAHWMHAADVDGDGCDEVVLGSAVVDHDGKALWSTGLGHPDHSYVGDIDPKRPGLEIYYGIERRQPEANGMCLVDAATGKILWGHQGPTRHVHSRGMCSDIDPRYPGSECYSADTDVNKNFAWATLRTAKGEIISRENIGGFGALTVYWDADPQRELILGRSIQDYRGQTHSRIEGRVAAVADVLGDWREELIVTVPGELRIYCTTIPAKHRHPCLMSDHLYRMDVAVATMGYYQVPMLSYDLATVLAKKAKQ